jgi:hypothetical protein
MLKQVGTSTTVCFTENGQRTTNNRRTQAEPSDETHRRRATCRGVRIPLECGRSGEQESTKDDETRAQHRTQGAEAEQEEGC